MQEKPVLVIGGAGKTGGRVNARLGSRGIATRPVSRSTAIPFDWTQLDHPARNFSNFARAAAADGAWRT